MSDSCEALRELLFVPLRVLRGLFLRVSFVSFVSFVDEFSPGTVGCLETHPGGTSIASGAH